MENDFCIINYHLDNRSPPCEIVGGTDALLSNKQFSREKLAGAKLLQKAHLEIGVAHHDAAVALKAGRRQALSQSVSHHKVRT